MSRQKASSPVEPLMTKTTRALRTDGEVTYNRILEVAGELFAASGFAETSNKAIATKAGVDLASVNYHFGSRSGLYEAVLAEAHRRFVDIDTLEEIAALHAPARDKLRKLIDQLLEGAAANQGWHAKVLGRELLSPSSHLQTLERQAVLPKLQIVLALLSEITSIPAGDPVLRRCLASVATPCAVMLLAGHHPPAFAAEALQSPRPVLADHLYTFSIGGLEAVARSYAETNSRPSSD